MPGKHVILQGIPGFESLPFRVFIFRVLFFLILISQNICLENGAWAAEGHKPSSEIITIFNQLKKSEYTLDLTGFDKSEKYNTVEDPLKGEYEEYTFPKVEGFDMFYYVIKYDKRSRKFWVWMTGGFAYQNVLYGPGYLNDSGNIERKVNGQ